MDTHLEKCIDQILESEGIWCKEMDTQVEKCIEMNTQVDKCNGMDTQVDRCSEKVK